MQTRQNKKLIEMKPRQELKEGGKKQAGISVDHL
jgi:hypothetical protein